ncbi:MAG: DsbA family protein [Psychromonas sp.]
MNNSESRFYYIHDPMCSWCWAHYPQWSLLDQKLSQLVEVEYLVGGLAPDSDLPMPAEQCEAIEGYWKKINRLLGTEFNHQFWLQNTPRRSTYPACRAVIAASWQGALKEMNLALQEAYYLRAMNPSDVSVLLVLAAELGLDVDKFAADIASGALALEFATQLQFAHQLPIRGFPSMVLAHKGQMHAIALDYKDHSGALEQVKEILAQ